MLNERQLGDSVLLFAIRFHTINFAMLYNLTPVDNWRFRTNTKCIDILDTFAISIVVLAVWWVSECKFGANNCIISLCGFRVCWFIGHRSISNDTLYDYRPTRSIPINWIETPPRLCCPIPFSFSVSIAYTESDKNRR